MIRRSHCPWFPVALLGLFALSLTAHSESVTIQVVCQNQPVAGAAMGWYGRDEKLGESYGYGMTGEDGTVTIEDFEKKIKYTLAVVASGCKYKKLEQKRLRNGYKVTLTSLPHGTEVVWLPSVSGTSRDRAIAKRPAPIFGEGDFELGIGSPAPPLEIRSVRDDVFIDFSRDAKRKSIRVRVGESFWVKKGDQLARCKLVAHTQIVGAFPVIEYSVREAR